MDQGSDGNQVDDEARILAKQWFFKPPMPSLTNTGSRQNSLEQIQLKPSSLTQITFFRRTPYAQVMECWSTESEKFHKAMVFRLSNVTANKARLI